MTHYADMTDPPEAIRLHLDWWGKCLTCSKWPGDRTNILAEAFCDNSESPMYRVATTTEGHCPEWDTFDIEAAVALLDDEEQRAKERR